jgi:hypothetical protein
LEEDMNTKATQTFTFEVGNCDLILGDEGWLPEYIEEMRRAGFSLKGGLYVSLAIVDQSNADFGTFAYVQVARRMRPIEREPESEGEASLPEFMEYRAFHRPTDWGPALLNGLIAANMGKIPIVWLSNAMARVETGEVAN